MYVAGSSRKNFRSEITIHGWAQGHYIIMIRITDSGEVKHGSYRKYMLSVILL